MHKQSDRLTRREMLRMGTHGTVLGCMVGTAAWGALGPVTELCSAAGLRGRINQSVCFWCYDEFRRRVKMNLDRFAAACAKMGLKSLELAPPDQWPTLKKHGLICAMTKGHGFIDGMNRKENHPLCVQKLKASIDATAEAGFPNVITFSGLRRSMPDDVGLENTILGLKQVIGYAERKKVNLCLEVLNSRVNIEMKGHPDYMCDKVEWAAEVCKRIASERMKILFDIYHVQIMEGDIITRLRQYHEYIGHYHVAGVPGRSEIDDTQEINYPAIMRAIVATGYTGYVGHEFIPARDPIQSLHEAVQICDV